MEALERPVLPENSEKRSTSVIGCGINNTG